MLTLYTGDFVLSIGVISYFSRLLGRPAENADAAKADFHCSVPGCFPAIFYQNVSGIKKTTWIARIPQEGRA
jgi:hypothetical protein